MSDPKAKPRIVCCIGDTHGFHTKLQNLWSNLQSAIDPYDFSTALIISLGDYCDRGQDTKKQVGAAASPSPTLPPFDPKGFLHWQPEQILDRGMFKKKNTAVTKWLIKWAGLPTEDATWEEANDIIARYPEFQT